MSAPPTPPAENLKERKENFCFLLPRPKGADEARIIGRQGSIQNTFELRSIHTAERNFRIRKVGRSPRRRRGSGQKSPSLRDELGRDGCGEMGGFVTNQRVRSDFLDERLDLVQIKGGGQKIGLFHI